MSKEPLAKKYLLAENLKTDEIQWIEEIDLDVGNIGDGFAADSTGIKVDGEFQETVPSELLQHAKSAKLVYGKDSSAGDDTTDVILRDYTAAANINTSTATGASTHSEIAITPANLTVGNSIGVRVDVTTASATTGATASLLNVKLIVVCGVS